MPQFSGTISKIKSVIVPRGSKPRTIVGGLFRGVHMEIDLTRNTQLFLGLAEHETHAFIRRCSKHATWAVDVGAAEGELSMYFARLQNITAVYAVEPDTRHLLGNINRAIGRSKIRVIPKCAGPEVGQDMVAVDSLVHNEVGRGFIKIDVDGGEVEVLLGMRRVLETGAADVLIETHSKLLEEECISMLTVSGYRTEIIPNAWWRRLIPEQRPISHNRWIAATQSH